MVRRGFVDLEAGQVHYRCAGDLALPPLVMLHASPGSSRQLERLIDSMGAHFRVIAPDTLGNGDSMPPLGEQPEIADYADAVIEVMDKLAPGRIRLYGTHTGARIATHLALTYPDRIDRLILDGFGLYEPDDLDEILSTYAPEMAPDQAGLYALRAWQFSRDQALWFPWFRKSAQNRVPHDLPDAQALHVRYLEILKALTTYHKSYRAAFRYSMREAVPRIAVPTMITFAEDDLVRPVFEQAKALLPGARAQVLPGIRSAQAVVITTAALVSFLNE
jgi:pimeloyl-ACP methyl ester carboxylesterase